MYTIFLVEDDYVLKNNIKEILNYNNYKVLCVSDYKNIMEEFRKTQCDLVLMDINLPYLDGNYFCKTIRRESNVPLIITSARNTELDQVFSLEIGADDYLVKPFSMNILLAKINASLRRKESFNGVINLEDLKLNLDDFSLSYSNSRIDLSKSEFRLMKMLISSSPAYIERDILLEEIWDDKDFIDDNTLSVNISRIKQKLSRIKAPYEIKTKRGLGYSITKVVI